MDDVTVLLLDVADGHELHLAVIAEELVPDSLHEAEGGAPSRDAAVLYVPEHSDGDGRLVRWPPGARRLGAPPHSDREGLDRAAPCWRNSEPSLSQGNQALW